jgi:crotonobetainyl-CoA:carnitine CoA-transferase CaiB-like acyl-CoA transferase
MPLAGKRLLDFSQGVAGPYCAMLLGDLGAEVIKVEPLEGDWSRAVGSLVRPHESSAHLSLNRNKRSICLNLKHERGREIALKLAHRSDIVVQNFRRGVMEKFGLGYDDLSTHNPRLVYASIFGFGEEGPLADSPASDSVMQAFGGLMSINGDRGGPPLRVGNMVSDMLAGMYLSQGVLAALLTLGASGRGQRVSVSLLDALVAFQGPPVMEYCVTGKVPPRNGRSHPLIAPAGTYQVADGFVTLAATQPRWEKFCKAIGMPELAHDPRFAGNDARLNNREALQEILVPFFARRTKAQVLQLAQENDLLCAPINDYESLLQHPQVEASRLVHEWTHPQLGHFQGIRSPIRSSEGEARYSPPPLLGEHGAEILSEELGFDAREIERLKADGAM